MPNASYYLKAYATNEAGTAYGEELSFKTRDVSGLNGLWAQGSIVVSTGGNIDGVAFSPDGSIVKHQDGNTFELISSNLWIGGPASTMYTPGGEADDSSGANASGEGRGGGGEVITFSPASSARCHK